MNFIPKALGMRQINGNLDRIYHGNTIQTGKTCKKRIIEFDMVLNKSATRYK